MKPFLGWIMVSRALFDALLICFVHLLICIHIYVKCPCFLAFYALVRRSPFLVYVLLF